MIRMFIIVFFLMGSFIARVDSGAAKFDVTEVKPRIITPTTQLRIRVESESLESAPRGRIFDITGKEVAFMEQGEGDLLDDYYTHLIWRPGNNIPSGVYIYQLEAMGYIYNGTIVVAR